MDGRLPSLARLSLRQLSTGDGGNREGKRRVIVKRGGSGDASFDEIPGELLEIVTNFLADRRGDPASVCNDIARWCMSHKRPCEDPDVFRMALAAFGFTPPRGTAPPGGFRSWRDFLYYLCRVFTLNEGDVLWQAIQRAFGGQTDPVWYIRRELRTVVRTQRQIDEWLEALMYAWYVLDGGQVVYGVTPGEGIVRRWGRGEIIALQHRDELAALYWLLKLRGGGLRSGHEYEALDGELYQMIRRLIPRSVVRPEGAAQRDGPLDWNDQAARDRIKELIALGANPLFEADGDVWPLEVPDAIEPDDSATMLEAALMTQNAELVELMLAYMPAVREWHDYPTNLRQALAVFANAPGAGAVHARVIERLLTEYVRLLVTLRATLEDTRWVFSAWENVSDGLGRWIVEVDEYNQSYEDALKAILRELQGLWDEGEWETPSSPGSPSSPYPSDDSDED